MYYVYEWFIKDTGEIIYVGKGTGRRYRVRKRNRFFDSMLERYDCESRIVESFQDEKDAFAYEFDRINELKSRGQCVCNIYRGGLGGTTKWRTEEKRKKYSIDNVMKSEAQRTRMSENNPMKDPTVSHRVAEKKSRPIIIGNTEYGSVKLASKAVGCSTDTIRRWCSNGINDKGDPCRYKDGLPIKKYKITAREAGNM